MRNRPTRSRTAESFMIIAPLGIAEKRSDIACVLPVVVSFFTKSNHSQTKYTSSRCSRPRVKTTVLDLSSGADAPSIETSSVAGVGRGGGEAEVGDEAISGGETI